MKRMLDTRWNAATMRWIVCQMNKRPCIGRHLSVEGGAKISDSDRSRNSNERYAAYCPGYSMMVGRESTGCNWERGSGTLCRWEQWAGLEACLLSPAGGLVVRWSGDLAVTATGTLTMDMCHCTATPHAPTPAPSSRPGMCVLVMHMSFKYNYIQIHSLALFGRNMESFYPRFAYAFSEYFHFAALKKTIYIYL